MVADAATPRRRGAERGGHRPRRPGVLSPGLLRLRHRHPQHRPPGRGRPAVHRLPRHAAVLADPRRAADRPQPPLGGDAGGVQLQHRLPPHAGPDLQPRGDHGRGPASRGLHDPRASASGTCARWRRPPRPGPYDQWPLQRGFDRFYGFLDGEADQFTPELVHDNHAVAAAEDGRGGLPPQRGPGRQGHRLPPRHRLDPPGSTVLHLPGLRRHPRPPPGPGRVPREVPRPLRRGLGRGPGALVRPPEGARDPPTRDRVGPPQPRGRGLGGPAREPPQAGLPPAGGLRRLPRPHRRPDRAPARRPGGARPPGRTPSSSCWRTTEPARRAGPSASCTR